jgi:hypothetical protein
MKTTILNSWSSRSWKERGQPSFPRNGGMGWIFAHHPFFGASQRSSRSLDTDIRKSAFFFPPSYLLI